MSIAIGPEQVQSLNEQVGRLENEEPYLAVITTDGQVFVRSTLRVPASLVELWRRNPATMIPDSAGYQPATRVIAVARL